MGVVTSAGIPNDRLQASCRGYSDFSAGQSEAVIMVIARTCGFR
jgi:hypothetical protein